MSYDLHFDCGPLENAHQISGGTYASGGTTEPWLNITYNYASHFNEVLGEGGIRTLYGKPASEVAAICIDAVSCMSGGPSDSYWDATEGNARTALLRLHDLAKICPPDAILSGD